MISRRLFTMSLVTTVAAPALAQDVDDDAIRDILRARVETKKLSVGMAVCVVTPARQRFVAYGHERLEGGADITQDTVFEVASITKVFTALLFADMVRRGKIGLDDPASLHLPSDFRLPQIGGRPITLVDLATHTAGLPRFPQFQGTPFSPSWLDALAKFSPSDFKSWLADFRLRRQPGAAWEYSNAGYALLGMALAHRGERPYNELLRQRILEPLGLRNTAFQPTNAMRRRIAEGHDATLRPMPSSNFGIFDAAGGLRSTPRDLSRVAATLLSGRRTRMVQNNELLLTTQRPVKPIEGAQALGWEVLNAPGGAFVSKDGVSYGQAASFVYDATQRIAIVTFSNTLPNLRGTSPSGGGVGAADVARHLLRPEIPLGM